MLQNMTSAMSAIEARLEGHTARGLARAVTAALRDGAVQPGTRLPPIRAVATQLGLSPTTVSAGWALLARSGAIRTDGRRGTTVANVRDGDGGGPGRYRRALERQLDFALDLSTGTPDPALLPKLAPALGELTTAGIPGSYLDDPVLPALMDVLMAQWPYPPQELMVVDGAMDGLDLVSRSMLRPGDRVVVEHPSFPPLLDLLESIGVEVVGVPVDGEGLRPEPLRAALRNGSAAVFLQPRAQNPTGASMTAGRARDLAAILSVTGLPVVEDDSAGAVAASDPISLGQWIPDQVIHIRSFSKSHGPDLRLAAMAGPRELLGEVIHRRQLGQGWSSRLLQRVLLSLLTDPVAIADVEYARDEYTRRRRALVAALTSRGVEVATGDGLNLWVPVHDESAAIVRLARQGVGVTPGTPFDVTPGGDGHVRITAGLVADGYDELAQMIATAAHTSGWVSRSR
jgi:DNA-binding transcriptional MocR family regulator